MAVNFFDYIQLIYTIILLPFYFIFTIRLGYYIYYKKAITVRNEFYPIMFYKGVIDVITVFVMFATSRIQKYNVFDDFFLRNNFIAYILYFTSGGCFCIMFEIAFLVSVNRYIALCYPMKYKDYFSFRNITLYITVMTLIGFSIGIVCITYTIKYVWLPEVGRVSGIYVNSNNAYFNAAVAVFFYLPLSILTSILNFLSFYEHKKILSKQRVNNHMDYKLFTYNIISMFVMIGFEIYYMFRYLPYVLEINKELEAIAIKSLSWIVDIMTFGLFILSLTLSKVLRSLLPYYNKNQSTVGIIA